MLVSIIIVSWNARGFLSDCLESIYSQNWEFPIEIIVVDNDSSDGSPEMVEAKFPSVRLIRTGANLGFAKGNNIGIRKSKGEFLCLMNSDVKILPGCLEKLLSYSMSNPEVGMVGPRIQGGDGKLQRSCRGFPTLWSMFCRCIALDRLFPKVGIFTGYSLSNFAHDTTRKVEILSGCFWLVKRRALEEVGFLDEEFFMYGEDMDWCRRFWKQGWELAFVPAANAIHYGGASSANSPVRFFIEMQRADLQYWRKHHAKVAPIFFLLLIIHLTIRAIGHRMAEFLGIPSRADHSYKYSRSISCLNVLVGGKQETR